MVINSILSEKRTYLSKVNPRVTVFKNFYLQDLKWPVKTNILGYLLLKWASMLLLQVGIELF